MPAPITGDPLLTIADIANYAKVGPGEVRRHMKRAATDPRHLPGVMHAGKLKARLSVVDAWIDRNSAPAA